MKQILIVLAFLFTTPALATHGPLWGPFSDAHTLMMNKPFDVVWARAIAANRVVWHYWPLLGPSDDMLETAFHVDRARFCCVSEALRNESRAWLAARGRSHICFDTITPKMYPHTDGRC
jgi:hypothetical protein